MNPLKHFNVGNKSLGNRIWLGSATKFVGPGASSIAQKLLRISRQSKALKYRALLCLGLCNCRGGMPMKLDLDCSMELRPTDGHLQGVSHTKKESSVDQKTEPVLVTHPL